MRYAFRFDGSACTGCKACQVACKDKNGLPTGVLWRRVYEVSGGDWERRGEAWTHTVFAYNVSVGCNHCEAPACVTACPTCAYMVRDDGIVWQESEKCIGCEYCVWACPYGAPQYSPAEGRTSKCDFCLDLIDEGLPPACVGACPMRALDIVETQSGAELPRRAETQSPFPMTNTLRTRPGLAIEPHRAMLNDLPKIVANYEEVRPRANGDTHLFLRGLLTKVSVPISLVAFTLLGQAAAGIAIVSLFDGSLARPLFVAIGLLLAAAALVSLLHLGRASGACRAPATIRTSRLSREIVMLASFGAAWLLAFLALRAGQIAMAVCGAGLVFSMGRVYRLDAVPPWNSWRTEASFAASALLLGALAFAVMSPAAASSSRAWIWPLAMVLLGVQAWLSVQNSELASATLSRWRVGLIVLASIAICLLLMLPASAPSGLIVLAVLAGFGQELLARYGFYQAPDQKAM